MKQFSNRRAKQPKHALDIFFLLVAFSSVFNQAYVYHLRYPFVVDENTGSYAVLESHIYWVPLKWLKLLNWLFRNPSTPKATLLRRK
jgi:hypothetical protein